MSETDNREQQPNHDLDQALGAILKNVSAALDLLAETIDTAGANLMQPSSRKRPSATIDNLQIDIFDEGGEILVVIELPGVRTENIRIDVQDDILDLSTEGSPRFAHELLLPALVKPESLRWTYRTGILEIRLDKASANDPA
jgi:HSP20 family molecular chaperone IbpA